MRRTDDAIHGVVPGKAHFSLVVKELWAEASNTLRRREVGAVEKGCFCNSDRRIGRLDQPLTACVAQLEVVRCGGPMMRFTFICWRGNSILGRSRFF